MKAVDKPQMQFTSKAFLSRPGGSSWYRMAGCPLIGPTETLWLMLETGRSKCLPILSSRYKGCFHIDVMTVEKSSGRESGPGLLVVRRASDGVWSSGVMRSLLPVCVFSPGTLSRETSTGSSLNWWFCTTQENLHLSADWVHTHHTLFYCF